jgi:hypothetical protein
VKPPRHSPSTNQLASCQRQAYTRNEAIGEWLLKRNGLSPSQTGEMAKWLGRQFISKSSESVFQDEKAWLTLELLIRSWVWVDPFDHVCTYVKFSLVWLGFFQTVATVVSFVSFCGGNMDAKHAAEHLWGFMWMIQMRRMI